jgi:hypothetical protein
VKPLQVLHAPVDQLGEGNHLILLAVTGDGVDEAFGLIGEALGILRHLEGPVDDLGARGDQPAKQGVVGHDPGVVARARRSGDRFHQVGDVEGPVCLLELAPPLELLDPGDGVHGLAPRVQVHQGLVHHPVRPAVEIVALEDLDDLGYRLAREHHGPEHRLLGFQVVGRDPLRSQRANLVSGAGHRFLLSSTGANAIGAGLLGTSPATRGNHVHRT